MPFETPVGEIREDSDATGLQHERKERSQI